MALKALSVQRREIFDLARVAVDAAARDGGLIAATTTARRILDTVPDSEMSASELENEISRLAGEKRVIVEPADALPGSKTDEAAGRVVPTTAEANVPEVKKTVADLTNMAKNTANLAKDQRNIADLQGAMARAEHETAHKLEKISANLATRAAELKQMLPTKPK